MCNKRHHTSICDSKQKESEIANDSLKTTKDEENAARLITHTVNVFTPSRVLLKTAIADISSLNQNVSTTNILFDEGAQRSFITEQLADKLDLKTNSMETLTIAGFGESNKKTRQLRNTTVLLHTDDGKRIRMDVLVVPQIAFPVQSNVKSVSKLEYLKHLKLANPITEMDTFDVELLIGADYYWDVVEDEIIRGDGPTAMKSKIGYLLSGAVRKAKGTDSHQNSTTMMNILSYRNDEECQLQRFWEIESTGTEQTTGISGCETTLKEYQEKNVSYNGYRYTAKLPWKDDFDLPTNEAIAKKRTVSTIRHLSKDENIFQIYGQIIAEQEKKGFVEKIPEDQINSDKKTHYIPHHPVKKESSTTPIRIVYDCSLRVNKSSPSLNDCLKSTPPQLNKITNILMKFRQHRYGVTSDIEKAFLQVQLTEEDKDVTRFFWLESPKDPSSKLIPYRFNVVLFGATCSPYILNAVLLKHLSSFKTDVAEALQNDIYVDNVITSVKTKEEAETYFTESRHILKEGGFILRSWMSNDTLLRELAQSEGVLDTDNETKVLGMRWKSNEDFLTFSPPKLKTSSQFEVVTKRTILSESSSVFDPLGFLGPVTIRSKLLMQKLWSENYAWDILVPLEIQQHWVKLKEDLHEITTKTKIPRRYFNLDDIERPLTLHIFVDASSNAYGACAYFCNGEETSLVMAKNKVSPLKGATLPKLELMAAVLGVRLARDITEAIKVHTVNYWSDSQIVLYWISNNKPQSRFITKRILEIRSLSSATEWKYVPTDVNPADLQTRGISASQLIESKLWKHGPEWIKDPAFWPVCTNTLTTILEEHDESDRENYCTTFNKDGDWSI